MYIVTHTTMTTDTAIRISPAPIDFLTKSSSLSNEPPAIAAIIVPNCQIILNLVPSTNDNVTEVETNPPIAYNDERKSQGLCVVTYNSVSGHV